MATPTRYRGKVGTALRKAAAILTTTGFFAAAVVLAAILWLPANATPASAAVENQTSLLLSLDKPERPAPKFNLGDLSSLTAEDVELASASRQDLTAELNSWTYTQNPLGDFYVQYVLSQMHNIPLFNFIAHIEFQIVTFLLSFLHGFPIIGDFLGFVQNTLSPYA